MIERRLVDVNERVPTGAPPLVRAARHGRAKIAEMLLRAGARIDDATSDGHTACHVAVELGHVDVLGVLLAHRPNLRLRTRLFATPLDCAFLFVNNSTWRVVAMLLAAGAPLVDEAHLCTAAGLHTAVVQALLDRDDVVVSDLRDDNECTPLHMIAARNGGEHDPALLEMLVGVCGVDLEARDISGNTCCYTAAVYGNEKMLRWLVQAGADIEAVNNHGVTPLVKATKIGFYIDSVIVLIAAGASVHAADPGKSAKMRQILIAAGASALPDQARRAQIDPEDIKVTHRRIARARLDFVRSRALQVCIGLQSRGLDALQTCEILLHACGRVAPLISFHHWWNIAIAVKHFHQQR